MNGSIARSCWPRWTTSSRATRFREHLVPLTQQEGLHLKFAQCVNFHPVATVGDLENYVRRLRAFPAAVDATIAVMRQGIADRRGAHRPSRWPLWSPSFGRSRQSKPEDSPLMAIAAKLPSDWAEADRARTKEAVRQAVAEAVSPAYARFAEFVESEYLPACRESIGLCDTPDGAEHYAYLVRSFTTTDLSPDAVHAIGLKELAKNRAAADAIRQGRVSGRPQGVPCLREDRPEVQEPQRDRDPHRYRAIFQGPSTRSSRTLRQTSSDRLRDPADRSLSRKAAAGGYYYPAPRMARGPAIST